jgi:hypothetical protein
LRGAPQLVRQPIPEASPLRRSTRRPGASGLTRGGSPLMRRSPVEGVNSPATIGDRVVFPAPLAPMIPSERPARGRNPTSHETPRVGRIWPQRPCHDHGRASLRGLQRNRRPVNPSAGDLRRQRAHNATTHNSTSMRVSSSGTPTSRSGAQQSADQVRRSSALPCRDGEKTERPVRELGGRGDHDDEPDDGNPSVVGAGC